MGGPVFDRQVFVKKQQAPRPFSRSPLPGGLILILVAALSAFATYRFVKAGGKETSDPADKARIAELQTKLKATQDQVQELEKRRHAAPARAVSQESKPSGAKVVPAVHKAHAESASRPNGPRMAEPMPSSKLVSKDPIHGRLTAGSAASAAPLKTASLMAKPPAPAGQAIPNKELNKLQGNLAANHDEWEATTDRLGNVVGELDSQQSAIQQTQSGVNYLLERVQRSDVSFSLKKGSGLQHVGPIAMEFESASVKGQHYTIRMMVEDKSILLKDRALNEIVQFYTSRSKYPLRLIVSQIGRGEVSGTLAVPTSLSEEVNNSHLRER
jgi:hypothetical protein